MSREREAHQPKTMKERREYINTMIHEAGPTIQEPSFQPDGTDTPQTRAKPAVSTLTSTKPEPRLVWKEEYTKNLLIGLALLLLGWGAFQIYSLNREVGVIGNQIVVVEEKQKNQVKELEKIETRIQRTLELSSGRVDKIEERVNDLQKFNYSNLKN